MAIKERFFKYFFSHEFRWGAVMANKEISFSMALREAPGTGRDPGNPGPRGPGDKLPSFGLFLLETSYSDAGFRILAKNHHYGAKNHQKWIKLDPFRAHLKLRPPGEPPGGPQGSQLQHEMGLV